MNPSDACLVILSLNSPWSLVGVSGYGQQLMANVRGRADPFASLGLIRVSSLIWSRIGLKYLTGCFVDLDRGEGKGG